MTLDQRRPHHRGIDRRRFLLTSLAGVVAAPPVVEAQKAPTIGVRTTTRLTEPVREAIRDGLRDGYIEGQNFLPRRTRVALLINPVGDAFSKSLTAETQAAAKASGIAVHVVNVSRAEELDL